MEQHLACIEGVCGVASCNCLACNEGHLDLAIHCTWELVKHAHCSVMNYCQNVFRSFFNVTWRCVMPMPTHFDWFQFNLLPDYEWV